MYVVIHTFIHIFQQEGDIMKKMDIAYMMMGAGAVLAYQKYKKPVKKEINKIRNKMMKKADNMLEDMM